MTPQIFAGLPDRKQVRFSHGVPENGDIQSVFIDVCRDLGVDIKDVTSKSRKREFVNARMIAIAVLCSTNEFTLKKIGNFIGVDHSSVIYLRNSFYDRISIRDKETYELLKKTNNLRYWNHEK